MNQKKLYKVRHGKKILGVCGGVAEYFDIDPTVVRLIWVILFFAFTFGFWTYIIAAIIMPHKDQIGL